MVYEARKQAMTWMETDYSNYALSMEEKKMAAGAFGRARTADVVERVQNRRVTKLYWGLYLTH